MDILKWFRQKKVRPAIPTEVKEIKKSLLEEICGEDKEVYEALYHTLLLNLKNVKEGEIEETIKKAEKAEKSGEKLRAAIEWWFAGGLALYQGNLKKVRLCYSRYQELTGKKLKILEIPERAVEKAREYYLRMKKE